VRALRRRRLVILGAVLAALLAAWAAGRLVRTDPAPTIYDATTVMIHAYRTPAASDLPGQITSLSTIAALARFDPVPQQVAARIGFDGDPLALAGRIRAFVDELGFLRIQARAPRARDAEILSRTFAEELNNVIEQRQVDAIDEVRGSLQQELSTTQRQLSALEESGITDGQRLLLLSDQRDGLRSQLRTLAGAVPDTGLQVIQPPVAVAVRPDASAAPSSPTARYLIALVLGLLLGIGLALLLERLDTRIRSREEARDSFELPVLAEVPVIPRASRDTVVTANGATSVEAESFRLLAAEISRGAVGSADQHADAGAGSAAPRPLRSRRQRSGRPSAILVTSGGPGEGKTTVVGNLAGTLAEAGNRVLVLSCDLRRPAIHRMFGVTNEVGLADGLGSRTGGGATLDGRVWETPVHGVRLVPTGAIAHRAPGELLSSDEMVDLLADARQAADIVLIDTSPILATSDATYLLSIVDAVVVVARAGKTTKAVAARTSEILRRFEAPTAGVVLNASSEITLPRDYRSYYYRDPTSGNGAGRRSAVRGGDPAARSTDEVPT
jgi:capsular exopolysaccharide synthesis family protein